MGEFEIPDKNAKKIERKSAGEDVNSEKEGSMGNDKELTKKCSFVNQVLKKVSL